MILSCAEDGPFKGGEPTLSDTYSPDTSGYGIMGQEGILMKAELDPSDARASDPNYFSTISSDAEFTFHGTFKYKTVIPPCGNGSIIHPSGAIILELQEN